MKMEALSGEGRERWRWIGSRHIAHRYEIARAYRNKKNYHTQKDVFKAFARTDVNYMHTVVVVERESYPLLSTV